MLQVKEVRKKYVTGDFEQIALNGVSLNLRDNEFVAILGPSGSGKTTLLNIIGGLDRYDSGDLIINGVSTKKYKDRDWDSYRNHTVGFVFQSYNLIPHQTILANVELALTIGGISKSERTKKALDALEQVGLKEQAHKKPNQMSGGQMQRVAIARALVNNPKVLLADEPTGALDTKTSVQVMELLKEVAKDRLVVMVTHNPELAEEYANRIVRVKDGDIIGDTNPFIVEEDVPAVHKNLGKASMSLLTSFGLSLNNLMTKKGRTFLTAFAGSIGIIGIALILSLSTGFQNYINQIQEETMTSYPLTIYEETADVFSALLGMHTDGGDKGKDDAMVEQQFVESMLGSIAKNDLKSFKSYLEDHEKEYAGDTSFIKYSYGVSPRIYTVDVKDQLAQLNPDTTMSAAMGASGTYMSSYSSAMGTGIFSEITDLNRMKTEYELAAGKWPEDYTEMVAVVSDPNQISDILLYSLGLRDTKELKKIFQSVMTGETVECKNEPMTITYDDLMNLELKLVDPTDTYRYNSEYETYEDMSEDEQFMKSVYENAETLKIVGIAYLPDTQESMSTGVFYLPELTYHVIEQAEKSELVQKQLANKDVDVFSGKRFDEEDEGGGLDFQNMISVDEDAISSAFQTNIDMGSLSGLGGDVGIDQEQMTEIVMNSSSAVAQSLEEATKGMVTALTTINREISTGIIETYIQTFSTSGNLMVNVGGMNTADMYRGQALNEAVFQGIVANISDIKVDPANLQKIATEAFDIYVGGLTPDETGMVAADAIPEVSPAVEQALANNEALIFQEGYNLAKEYTTLMVAKGVGEAVAQVTEPMAESMQKSMAGISEMFSGNILTVDQDKFASAFQFNMDEDELSRLMESMMTGEGASYSNNLINLGYQDLESPTSIAFYFKDFETKGHFTEWLKDYNKKAEKEKQLTYSDLTGMLMGSVETIINSVTYVLIAFVSISLIVSSIMIGIITYISVLERTKEIGILRAIGASKRNISSIFNAETFIIGFLSGLIGVGVTYLLNIPINSVIHTVTGNPDITAVLDPVAAVILVVIATVLTMVGGLLPSKSASKKDPVIALRTE